MSLAIATASQVRVLCYNYHDLQWGEEKTCRVRVIEESGEYILRIDSKDGGERVEHKLSKKDIEVQFYKGAGFIQVLFTKPTKELLGIKFRDDVNGEEFYLRMISKLDVPCSYPQTTIGKDGNPDPVGQKPVTKPAATKSVPQSLPPQAQTGNKSANISQLPKAKSQPSQAPPSIFATLGSQPSKSVAPHQGWKAEAIPQVIKVPAHQEEPSQKPASTVSPHDTINQPVLGVPVIQHPYSQSAYDTDETIDAGSSIRKQDSGVVCQSTPNTGPIRKQDSGVVCQSTPNTGPIRKQDSGVVCQSTPNTGPVLHHGNVHSIRKPWVTAELLTDAINRRHRVKAQTMFDALLSESNAEPGRFEVIYHATPVHISAPTFTLCIEVEFQQPQKDPCPIFLFDITANDTLHTLSLQVEQEFFIPRLSQNWIIGPHIVKGTEMNKALKDFGIRGPDDAEEGVSVFMYVMHIKKAQVPVNTVRMRYQQQQQLQDHAKNEKDKPTVAYDIQHSDYLIEAEKRMGISFLGHCILECDSHGLEYTNKEHDITVRIPEGAVADGEIVHIEFVVAMYGPFHFPDNVRPISPILWLCPLERNARLKKPSQIVLPHALDGLTKEKAKDYHVGFVKVHHNDFYITESGQLTYTFQPLSSEGDPLFSTIGESHYGLLKTSHFCYLCMAAERNNSELEKDIDYCLTRIEMPITDIRHKAIFCLSYHLPTCIEAIEGQFPNHKFKTSPPFKLMGNPGSVKLVVEESKCTVAMEPILPVLEAKDVEYSRQSIKQLELMHKRETYPPRITMTFDTTLAPQQTLTVRVRVEGTYRDKQLSADLLLPFVNNGSHPSHKLVTIIPHSQNVKDKMDEIPKPSELEVLKYMKGDQMIRLKIISRASHKWRDIAALVSQDTNKADNLEQKYTNPVHCLRQIFREDFISKKPTSYSQNWEGLIEVLYDVEEDNLAEEVKHVIEKFADVVV